MFDMLECYKFCLYDTLLSSNWLVFSASGRNSSSRRQLKRFNFKKLPNEKFSFLLLSAKNRLAQNLEPILHLHMLVFKIPKHLCAKLQTGLIPPRSDWTNLSVCSTRWTHMKKKPNSSPQLTADFHWSTSHWTNFILEENVQLKVFLWFDCSSRNSLVEN